MAEEYATCVGCGHESGWHRIDPLKVGILEGCNHEDCECPMFESPKSPWAEAKMHESKVMVDDNGNPVTYPLPENAVHSATLVAMTPEQHAAHVEFREAAKQARDAQVTAQAAANRYALAVRTLSEVFGGDGGPQ